MAGPGVELRPLDAWLLARTNRLIGEAEAAYDAYLTVDVIDAFERFLEDLSNWYIRRSRRRLYSFDEAAFRTVWIGLVQAARVVAPVLPFLSEHLWQALITGACPNAPASVHLAGWPAGGGGGAGAGRPVAGRSAPGGDRHGARRRPTRPPRGGGGEPQAPTAAAQDVRARRE